MVQLGVEVGLPRLDAVGELAAQLGLEEVLEHGAVEALDRPLALGERVRDIVERREDLVGMARKRHQLLVDSCFTPSHGHARM